MNQTISQIICDNGFEDVLIYDNPSYESAFIGITTEGQSVYDYNKMVEFLMNNENMSEEEAIDFISYNTLGAHVSDKDPIVIYTLN